MEMAGIVYHTGANIIKIFIIQNITMLRGFLGNLICAIIARMLCGNHLNLERVGGQ